MVFPNTPPCAFRLYVVCRQLNTNFEEVLTRVDVTTDAVINCFFA